MHEIEMAWSVSLSSFKNLEGLDKFYFTLRVWGEI